MTKDPNNTHTKLTKEINDRFSYQSISKEIKTSISPQKAETSTVNDLPSFFESIITNLVKKSVEVPNKVKINAIGTVRSIGNGIANISGLPQVGINELVEFSSGLKGLILNLETNSTDVILLGPEMDIHGGDIVTTSREKILVPVGPEIIGRVINALGEPLDNLPPIDAIDEQYIEAPAPGIIERAPVNEPLHTGIKIIDALFPIGKGQRELIIGDRQTGKTTLAIDTILSQKNTNVSCIYVSIGQKKSSVISMIETFRNHNAFEYTTVIIASPDDPPALRYLAPFTGCTMAEYFLHREQDVLIVFDDLSKHADSYREISLLLKRPPGREAYPGDIFYLHARLLERSCKLNKENGGGSITALPIITMQQGNISSYIPTNLISICDGQIMLNKDKFNKGYKPAIDIGLSVSRVGGAAQSPAMRTVSNELKLDLSQFEEVERFTRFGTDVDESTKQQIRRGQHLQMLLIQAENHPLTLSEEVIILFAASKGFIDHIELENISDYEQKLFLWLKENHVEIIMEIEKNRKLNKEVSDQLFLILGEFKSLYQLGDPFYE